jgi:membrane associated rhomboid family serine protease
LVLCAFVQFVGGFVQAHGGLAESSGGLRLGLRFDFGIDQSADALEFGVHFSSDFFPGFHDRSFFLRLSRAAVFARGNFFRYYRRAIRRQQGEYLVPLSPRVRYRLERWRAKIKSWFHSEPSAQRPRICPKCRSLAGVGTSHCPQCGANLNFSIAAASKSVSRFLPQTSPATYFIVALCGLLYALSYVLTMRTGGAPSGGIFDIGGIAPDVLDRLGASRPLPYDLAEPWRLVTAVFLHGSLLHIGFNLWVLMDIGPVIEDLYGSARYFFVFLFTGAFGYVASAAFGHFSIGASGGLLGLIGLLLAITTRRSSAGMQMLRKQLFYWLIYIAVLGFVFRGTDNAAHAGGFVLGFALGKILNDRRPAGINEERRAQAMGWIAGIAVAASFAMMLISYFNGAS